MSFGEVYSAVAGIGKAFQDSYDKAEDKARWGAIADQLLASGGTGAQPGVVGGGLSAGTGPADPSQPAPKLPTFAAISGSTPSSMPMAEGLKPHETALLNAIAAPESGGRYDIRYSPGGGKTFADFSQHPGVFEPGPAGPSSAAGRYQFTRTTWNGLGGGDFSPARQDVRALQLARQDYASRTGRDLDADLTTGGFTPAIAAALAPTWAGLKAAPGKAAGAYQFTLNKLSAGAGQPMVMPTAAAAAPPLQVGSAEPVQSGAVPDPMGGGGTISTTMMPREGGGFVPLPPARTQVASADPSFVPASAAGMTPGQILVDQARARSGDTLVPGVAASGLFKTAAQADAQAGRAPAAAPAQPAPAGSASDPLVVVPGINGGKPINRAWVEAAPDGADVPDDGVLERLQAQAGAGGGAGPATTASTTPAAPRATAAAAPSPAPSIPTAITPGSGLPPQVRPADNMAVKQMIGLMLRDPSTRAAGLQAMLNLQTKSAASAPFEFRGGLFQYGADGSLHAVIAPKDTFGQETDGDGNVWSINKATGQRTVALKADKASTELVLNPDGSRSLVDKDDGTAKPVAGLPAPVGARVWNTPGVAQPPGYAPNTPGYYDEKGVPHVGLTSGTDMAAAQKANAGLDKTITDTVEASYNKAKGAVGTLKAINRQKEAIDSGMMTGWGADWQTQARSFVAKLLGLPDDVLSDSEKFDAASTQKSAELAKTISQAGHTTNMDLQLGKTIAGGDRSKTEAALRSIVDGQEQLARDQIDDHAALLKRYGEVVPDVAPRLGVLKVDHPKVYEYGQRNRNPVADPGAAAGARTDRAPADVVRMPVNMTPDQAARTYRSGTRILLPDGSVGVVP